VLANMFTQIIYVSLNEGEEDNCHNVEEAIDKF
jgi:hypothetical protein